MNAEADDDKISSSPDDGGTRISLVWIAGRRMCFLASLLFMVAFALYRVELWDALGIDAWYVLSIGMLIAVVVGIWLACDLMRRLVRWGRRREGAANSVRALGAMVLFLIPAVALGVFPNAPEKLHLRRNEAELIAAVHRGDTRDRMMRDEYGVAFLFQHYTISDVWYYLIYEPNALQPGEGMEDMSHQLCRIRRDRQLWRSLGGPWYCWID